MSTAWVAAAAVCLVSLLACAAAEDGAKSAAAEPPLVLTATITLPDVTGRIDHLTLDTKRRRLYVAALAHGTVEVVDLAKGAWLRRSAGFDEPQGIAYLADVDRVAVGCGGDGTVHLLDGESSMSAGRVGLGDDTDNVHYAAAEKRLWAAFGNGGLAAIDPSTQKETGRVALDAHPEGFALEASGKRAFVNLASKAEVAVVDRASFRVTARWKVEGARSNYPMALDEAGKRLYVGCRSPARLIVLSTEDGRTVASAPCTDDPDDIFVDAARRRVHVVCGGGSVDVFDLGESSPKLRAKVPTAAGARTGLLDEASGVLWVAVPRRGERSAEIRVYEPR